jgi:DNA-binding NarL/FixJ family response regulator
MSNRKVLLIEDDEPKQRSIIAFLDETLPSDVEVVTAESLTSAVQILSATDVTFAIVDMSIPTFDFVKDRRGGGQPQGFGGADILRFIDSETTVTKSVVVTQYEEFILPRDGGRRDPRGLEEILRSELDHRFLGVIHYSGQHGAWRQELRDALGNAELLETT